MRLRGVINQVLRTKVGIVRRVAPRYSIQNARQRTFHHHLAFSFYVGIAIPNALQQLSLITVLPKLVPRSFVVVKEVNHILEKPSYDTTPAPGHTTLTSAVAEPLLYAHRSSNTTPTQLARRTP